MKLYLWCPACSYHWFRGFLSWNLYIEQDLPYSNLSNLFLKYSLNCRNEHTFHHQTTPQLFRNYKSLILQHKLRPNWKIRTVMLHQTQALFGSVSNDLSQMLRGRLRTGQSFWQCVTWGFSDKEIVSTALCVINSKKKISLCYLIDLWIHLCFGQNLVTVSSAV